MIGQNEYVGWYEMTPEDADKIHWTFPQKPVLMSEFGAEAKYGDHGATMLRVMEMLKDIGSARLAIYGPDIS